jgi:hypothetical protein
MVSKEALLFHQNKDGTLIERLRERRMPKKVEVVEIPEAKPKKRKMRRKPESENPTE